jgi:phosphoglycolate phosphatase-like HAD superfamily hydrolase
MHSKGLIVFDMDGVLVDVSKSYRDTVRQTARLFFKGAGSWEYLPDPLFSLADLARVKQSGGLNNDWDLTFLVINLLFTLVNGPTDLKDPDPWIRHNKVISSCDVSALSDFLNVTHNPVASLLKIKGKPKHEFIADLFTGGVGSGNIIKQIFQEIYLGKAMFEATYGIPTRVYHETGLITREKLLIDRSILENLSKNHILAIATGRPKVEADYPLDFFGLRKFFNVIYTLDDCKKKSKKYTKIKKKEPLWANPILICLMPLPKSINITSPDSITLGICRMIWSPHRDPEQDLPVSEFLFRHLTRTCSNGICYRQVRIILLKILRG